MEGAVPMNRKNHRFNFSTRVLMVVCLLLYPSGPFTSTLGVAAGPIPARATSISTPVGQGVLSPSSVPGAGSPFVRHAGATIQLRKVPSTFAAIRPGGIRVAALALASPQAVGGVEYASLVQVIDTSQWSPRSPDPSGIAYRASSNTLLIVDGEVEEMPALFAGKNVFEASLSGSLLGTFSTIGFTNEPVGVAVNPANGHIFISDDSKERVFEIDAGPDGLYFTSDDLRTSFSTLAFSTDPEGLAFGQGNLFVTDGVNAEINVVNPGPNGMFDGVPPAGDDQFTHFDTAVLGLRDPETVEFNDETGTLFIVSRLDLLMVETTTTGQLIRKIDIACADALYPAGLALAPGSQNPGVRNLYIAARGVDNNQDPNENDGKIYEVALNAPPPPPDNLLRNSSFETDANADTICDCWSRNDKKPFVTRSNGDGVVTPIEGNFVMRHQGPEVGYSIGDLVHNLTPGATYTLSGWVNIPPTSDAFSFSLQVRWLTESGAAISTKTVKTYITSTSGWNLATKNLVAPANAVRALIRMDVSGLSAAVYLDALVFKQL